MNTNKKPLISETTYRKIGISGLLGSLAIAAGFANVAAFNAGYKAQIDSLTSTGTKLLKIVHTPNTPECRAAANATALKLARYVTTNPEFKDTYSQTFQNNVKIAADNARDELTNICSTEIFDKSVLHAANALGGDNAITQVINKMQTPVIKVHNSKEDFLNEFNT